ncbi:lipopolysaccharide biosynthesis protein [Burkholderia anthina]|uniref:Oligosaccharide flippase family protein n=1 Tax=Burkholderia anthina TaxID=179879 RepID=A0A6P2GCR3_9BURK|nr:oligosaccharide flippase family protein [Burkholderia anthina]MBM2769076.1 oligosaccharide flippase family protein [Burkholderia anthina]VVU51550.1 putative polysaccharide biosynthesis transporter protein [Burkholderia anthina]
MLTRFLLRLSALGLKLVLTIVIARTLGFDSVAAYGLAIATSVIASKALGLGFGPELNRRLSEANPLPAIAHARTVSVGYAMLYLLLAAAFAIATRNNAVVALFDRFALSIPLAWCVLLVTLSEHAALEVNGWLFSLHRPRAGSILLFVRAGTWSGLASAALLTGAMHSIEAVFVLWIATNLIVVAVAWHRINIFEQRASEVGLPESAAHPSRISAIWLHGLPFYLAGVILSSLQYAERFIASRSLSADVLGQYVFAWSIASAAQAITFAVVVVTAAPRLIRTLADAPDTFLRRTTHAVTANIAVTLLASAIIFVAHPALFALTNEPIAEKNVTLLALLLVSFILRAATDVLWVAAVALRAGGVVLATIAALTLLYIPAARYLIGNSGAVGMALAHLAASFAIAAALALIVMRRGGVWHVKHPTEIASHAG